MKKFFLLLFLIITVSWCAGFNGLEASYVKIEKTAEWGSGRYAFIEVQGKVAYCASQIEGLDVFDISDPLAVKRLAAYTPPAHINGMAASGNYLYLTTTAGLYIINISNPAAPVLAALDPQDCYNINKSGDYLFLSAAEGVRILGTDNPTAPKALGTLYGFRLTSDLVQQGDYGYAVTTSREFITVDLSDPSSPVTVGRLAVTGNGAICVSGDYAFASRKDGMTVIDISKPSTPREAAQYDLVDVLVEGDYNIAVNCSYVYMGFRFDLPAARNMGLEVIDVSDPLFPTRAGRVNGKIYNDPGWELGIEIRGDYLYTAEKDLTIYSLSTPSAPLEVFRGDSAYGEIRDVTVYGDYAYVSKYKSGVHILDISDPSNPRQSGLFEIDSAYDLSCSGQYLYLAEFDAGLVIVDVSDPSAPREISRLKVGQAVEYLYVKDQYVYLFTYFGNLSIVDATAPVSPVEVGSLNIAEAASPNQSGVIVIDNYAYCSYWKEGGYRFAVVDVTDPANPVKVAEESGAGIYANGDYLYAPGAGADNSIHVYDISVPASPSLETVYNMDTNSGGMAFYGDFAFIGRGSIGIQALDVSRPASISKAGGFGGTHLGVKECRGDYIYAKGLTKLIIFNVSESPRAPEIVLDRAELFFGADTSGAVSPVQTTSISNGGGGNLDWTLLNTGGFVKARPLYSSTAAEIYTGVSAASLTPGTYKRKVKVKDYTAVNSPQTIDVTLTVYPEGATKPPFGVFATPTGNTIVQGSIPVTGWVLDDIGVNSVKIYRSAGNGLAPVGEAVFVEGARPDIEAAYPGYPLNYRAGWGYMLLTHFLPGGDGTYTLYAIATDMEGNTTTLGSKTITVNNKTAVKPFGAIDTPVQGGLAAGGAYTNFGWALTPLPKTIPVDGSTIGVYIDGQFRGNPVYNLPRSDIDKLFPGYNNTGGAVGYFKLDTTIYENGIHSIQWVVADNEGQKDGIGSRYFRITNTSDTYTVRHRRGSGAQALDIENIPTDRTGTLLTKTGLEKKMLFKETRPGDNGVYRVVMQELGNLEVRFKKNVRVTGYMAAGNRLVSLPVGSSFNKERNTFYWHAGPGFFGDYRLIFIEEGPSGKTRKKSVLVTIIAKSH
jgi:hypothetical protein